MGSALLWLAPCVAARAQEHPHGAGHARPGAESAGHGGHAAHGPVWSAGSWRIALHGFANLGLVSEGGPRGDAGFFTANMLGAVASRDAGPGRLEVRAMASLDPLMGSDGYPLLLQTGETADGETILFDRQHPHDLFMELGLRYRLPLGDSAAAFVHLAYPGEPALGPTAFVHRASAVSLPLAPTTHHWMDSTHIAYGVATAGLSAGPVTLEGSAFKGKEPDEKRWGFDELRIDSWSGRVSLRLPAGLSLQASAGWLAEPEFAHPGVDVTRYTASLAHAVEVGGARIDSTLVWGSIRRDTDIASGSFTRFPPSRRSDAWLLESRTSWSEHSVSVRLAWAEKDELFPLDHPFHGRRFPATRLSLSYLLSGVGPLPEWLSLGAQGALVRVPEDLEPFYGPRANSLAAFLRLELD